MLNQKVNLFAVAVFCFVFLMKAREKHLSAQLVNATAVSFQTKLPVLLESTSQVYIYLDPASCCGNAGRGAESI